MWSKESIIHHRRAQVGSVEIFYQVFGRGEPLVLLHGLSGSGRWWSRNIDALARHFRVYVVDLVGFGASGNGQRFVLREAAGSIAQWMVQIGIRRAAVVGHSMGGHIAADLAAEFPERVERLVLVDPAVLPLDPNYTQHTIGMLREARQMQLDFLPILLSDALRAGPRTIWQAANELLQTDLRPKLARISAPTLVIWGENDALLPLAFGKQLRRYLRYEELVVIKGAGHNPMWDRPRAFNQIITEFLRLASPRVEQHEMASDASQPTAGAAHAAPLPAQKSRPQVALE
jgi:pimeloyl-ACP methyl ester carboxylesterase